VTVIDVADNIRAAHFIAMPLFMFWRFNFKYSLKLLWHGIFHRSIVRDLKKHPKVTYIKPSVGLGIGVLYATRKKIKNAFNMGKDDALKYSSGFVSE